MKRAKLRLRRASLAGIAAGVFVINFIVAPAAPGASQATAETPSVAVGR